MKSLIVPLIVALVVSLAGSAGYAVMHQKSVHALYLAYQDSVARVLVDSLRADSAARAALPGPEASEASVDHDTLAIVPSLETALTPADSIRALLAAREAERRQAADAPHGATPVATATSTTPAAAPRTATPVASATTRAATVPPKDSTPATAPRATAGSAAEAAARAVAAATGSDVLPEKRLAKIFAAMSARDAAKVLEQMSDADIRTIVGMMGDRQAAAVLAALPATRAAAITTGGARVSGSTTP